MSQANLFLNFLEIKPKKFDVLFYYKFIEDLEENERQNFYKRNIKIIEGSDKTENIAITFEERVGFEKKIVPQDFDIGLTKNFLFYGLCKKVCNIETYENPKDKYSRIYFVLKKHKKGIETIWLEPYFLSKTNSFGLLIDFRFFVSDELKKSSINQLDREILQLSGALTNTGRINKERYIFKFEKIKEFLKKNYSTIKQFQIHTLFQISDKLTELNSFSLSTKTYLFYNETENRSPYYGLINYQPLQKPKKATKYIFLFKTTDRDIAVELLKGLRGESYPQQFGGIEKLFKIPFQNKDIKGKKVEAITSQVIDELISEIKESTENIVPIILTNSRVGKEDEKLYYLLKHKFTSNDIPCQVVTKELINNSYSLKYSLSNIGLQIFAKAGGKPWKIKPATNKCLIIGIGSKNKIKYLKSEVGKTIKKVERYFTYSVLSDSSGLFKEIKILSDEREEENYYLKLVANLKSVIEASIREGNKDIVIHSPYKISKPKVWDNIFTGIPDDITISVVIISDNHKFFGFDKSKNSLVPYESTSIAISNREYLVWFEGLQYNNSAFNKPIGSPIYINFWYSNKQDVLRELNFRKQLLQDCINLSGANWRGFKAKQLPVSIFYCQRISEFLTKFEEYGFESIQINNLKPWFL